jgi:acetoin utilization deacetylase AcuC-like enzyme
MESSNPQSPRGHYLRDLKAQASFVPTPHGTGFFSHRDCRLHNMGADHPESPERLSAIDDRLLITGVADALVAVNAPMVLAEDLLLAHTAVHVQRMQGLAVNLLSQAKALSGLDFYDIDPDTRMNPHTLQAAMRSAGAALAAVDAVMTGQLANAFCATRPPGHHAKRDQAMGFCFFSNVALAARYAQVVHGVQRVAIVDFDVHHGNGTQDVVQGVSGIEMFSFFQHPFYPYGEPFDGSANLYNTPVAAYTKGDTIKDLVNEQWLPRLHAFAPQLVLISAGFDAHRDDDLGQMGLVEADYAWITQQLVDVARAHAQGRIVSCLEGGYELRALANSVEAHIRVLADLA